MSEYALEVTNLTKKYKTGVEIKAVDNISFKIRKREFVSIMGPSGSGKSTLLNLVGLLDRPDEGEIKIDSVAYRFDDDDEISRVRNRKIGFVFQRFNLLPQFSAWENVKLPLLYAGTEERKANELAKEALIKVGLKERLAHRPNELSGGQQQRVAIARAIVNQPSLLLADEPTGNLDTRAGAEIMQIFQQLNYEGTTVLMITHEKEIAEYSERIIYLKDGRIVGEKSFPQRKREYF